jgi:GNAT superfamily N-acetyltransferase
MKTGAEMTVEISRYEKRDQKGVIDLILPIQREEFGLPITAGDQPDLKNIPGFYQTGSGDFWVARSGGKVVGSIGLKDIGHSQAALRKMFVAQEFRGRALGVSVRLLEVLLAQAREKGVTEIFLGTTETFLAAHRFYEKHGFVEIEKARLPEDFPLMELDTRFYAFWLGA